MLPFLRRVDRTLIRCLVCGSSEVRTDEVIDRGVVLLGECPRCEHRWTEPVARTPVLVRPSAARRVGRERREVATAA
jgi:hypothetical protein